METLACVAVTFVGERAGALFSKPSFGFAARSRTHSPTKPASLAG